MAMQYRSQGEVKQPKKLARCLLLKTEKTEKTEKSCEARNESSAARAGSPEIGQFAASLPASRAKVDVPAFRESKWRRRH
jgi:hypothetical protein